jgi:hypothetical protein
MRFVPAFKDKFDGQQCFAAQLPEDYTSYVCKGAGHDGGFRSKLKPGHGKCVVLTCTDRTSHKTKDSADCMKVVDEAREAGLKPFINKSTN